MMFKLSFFSVNTGGESSMTSLTPHFQQYALCEGVPWWMHIKYVAHSMSKPHLLQFFKETVLNILVTLWFPQFSFFNFSFIFFSSSIIMLLTWREAMLRRVIGNILIRLYGAFWTAITRPAISPPKVNRFGWNLERCEPNVGGWPLRT